MTLWIIEPQDPLIVRDGRPFQATPGARARSLPFPFPSTTAGGARTRAGLVDGVFVDTRIDEVKELPVRGPFLIEWKDSERYKFMVPAPTDALVFDAEPDPETNKPRVKRKWLQPLAIEAGANHDALQSVSYLVGMPKPDKDKPAKNAPAFWYWKTFKKWLLQPQDDANSLKAAKVGHSGPQSDRRLHVGIDPATFTSQDGDLFLTSGLTFWHRSGHLSGTRKLGLAIAVDDHNELTIEPGYAPLGGERRLMKWQKADQPLPSIPKKLVELIAANDGHCRLILLTPSYFENGWLPAAFGSSDSATVSLLAAAVPNPDVVSGWDFERGQPKATRRLVPAGAVYFLKVTGDIGQWVQERWLQPLSDDADFARAGFGITAVGVWDGIPKPIQPHDEEVSHG